MNDAAQGVDAKRAASNNRWWNGERGRTHHGRLCLCGFESEQARNDKFYKLSSDGMTNAEIGKKYGMSTSAVRKALAKRAKKMKGTT
jgi:hypothetical protein